MGPMSHRLMSDRPYERTTYERIITMSNGPYEQSGMSDRPMSDRHVSDRPYTDVTLNFFLI